MNHILSYPLLFAVAPISLAVLVDSAVKGCLLLMLALAVVVMLPRASASVRHLVWASALVGLLVLPAVSMALPHWDVLPGWLDVSALGLLEDVGPARAEAFSALDQELLPDLMAGTMSSSAEGASTSAEALAGSPAEVLAPPHFGYYLLSLSVAIWAAGVLGLGFRLALSRLFLWYLVRSSAELTEGTIYELFVSLRKKLGIGRTVRLLLSQRRDVPMTWGICVGHLLLPSEAQQWDRQRLRAVLVHELAHVKRWDALTQLLVQLACALYWFNPLVWVAAWRARVERERACDDFVLRDGMKASDYATHLVAISTGCEGRVWAHACALAMAKRLKLEGRLMRVLDGKLNRKEATHKALVLCFLALAASVIPVGMMHGEDAQSDGVAAPAADPGAGTFAALLTDDNGEADRFSEDQEARKGLAGVSSDEAEAVAALKNIGAEIQRDDEGKVISVEFNNPQQVTDADLGQLSKLLWRKTRLQQGDSLYPALWLLGGTKITDGGLEHLKPLTNLRFLSISRTGITDTGLGHLKGLANLENLWLDHTRITDTGLGHLVGLTDLSNLRFAGTDITDAGLVHVKELTNLKSLTIGKTNITDAGLAHLSGLVSLESLWVGATKITDDGLEHLKNLTNLWILSLQGTQVTGAGLMHLEGLSSLERLLLRGSSISDAGLVHLKGLTSLEHLGLGDTNITDAGLVHLKELTGLKGLGLNGTKITDAGLVHLTELATSLTTLGLYNTDISDAGLLHLKGLTKLTSLSLQDTDISGEGLLHLTGLSNLQKLFLQGTDVSDESVNKLHEALPKCEISYAGGVLKSVGLNTTTVPQAAPDAKRQEFGQATAARSVQVAVASAEPTENAAAERRAEALAALKKLGARIRLDENGKVIHVGLAMNTRVTDATLRQLKALTKLESLQLLDTQISDDGLEHLKGLTSLRDLRLGRTQITDLGLVHLKGLTNLHTLFLFSTQISDGGLIHLKNLQMLRDLNLRTTQITDAGLVHLKALPKLRMLVLNSTQITDAGLEHLNGLANLEYLSLASTEVTDAGLEQLKGLPNIQKLILSGDQFTEVGVKHLKKLAKLDLIGDKTSDDSLAHLKELPKLESLTLMYTQVSDTGLVNLKRLPNLKSLRIWNAHVSDAGLEHVKALTNLQQLTLFQTQVTNAGMKKFKEALPDCEISFDEFAAN